MWFHQVLAERGYIMLYGHKKIGPGVTGPKVYYIHLFLLFDTIFSCRKLISSSEQFALITLIA